MSQTSHPYTPYQEALDQALSQLQADGFVAVHPSQLAAKMGRSVTASMRRRLDQLVQAGRLSPFTYYTPAGGLAKAYHLGPQFELSGLHQVQQ